MPLAGLGASGLVWLPFTLGQQGEGLVCEPDRVPPKRSQPRDGLQDLRFAALSYMATFAFHVFWLSEESQAGHLPVPCSKVCLSVCQTPELGPSGRLLLTADASNETRNERWGLTPPPSPVAQEFARVFTEDPDCSGSCCSVL